MDASTARDASFGDAQRSPDERPGETDALTGYRQRQLELAEIVRAAMNLASQRRDEERREEARELLARLAEDRFELAVVGQFSRGKSTLMNSILGYPYLPTGALPMTSVVTSVRYGSEPRAAVRRRGSRLPIEIEDLVRFVAQPSTEREELEVVAADVEVPAEVLRLGFHFIDTPGIGSAIAANTATTKRFLPEADAVIFVTSFEAPLTEPELEFFDEVRSHVDKLFLVVNKLDLVSTPEADEILGFVRELLTARSDGVEQRIFAVSARDGLQAKLSGSGTRLAASGLPVLERSLVQFLANEKSRSFLLRTCDRAAGLLAGHRLDLELGRHATTRDEALSEFDGAITAIKAEQQGVIDGLLERVESEFADWLAERSETWRSELRRRVFARVKEGSSPSSSDLGTRLQTGSPVIAEEWFRRRLSKVRSALVGLTANELGELQAATSSVELVAAEIFGVSPPQRIDSTWSPADLPALAVEPPAFEMNSENRRRGLLRSTARGEQGALNALDRAVAVYVDDARGALRRAARIWVREIADHFGSATRKTADRVRNNLERRAGDDEIASVERLEFGLAAFRSEVQAWTPPASGAPLPISTLHSITSRCVICDQVAGMPFDYMAHAQLELARHPERRSEHTKGGGFCPMHTWQYAEIASELGIALGYSELARFVAELLRSLDDDGSPREEELTALAGRIVVGPERCPVCLSLATAEQDAIENLLAALPEEPRDETAPPLCVPHLAAALVTSPGTGRARWLAEHQAQILARLSEDMRTFALKHESVRRQLVSDEEHAAALRAISFLAGSRELARPWRRDDTIA